MAPVGPSGKHFVPNGTALRPSPLRHQPFAPLQANGQPSVQNARMPARSTAPATAGPSYAQQPTVVCPAGTICTTRISPWAPQAELLDLVLRCPPAASSVATSALSFIGPKAGERPMLIADRPSNPKTEPFIVYIMGTFGNGKRINATLTRHFALPVEGPESPSILRLPGTPEFSRIQAVHTRPTWPGSRPQYTLGIRHAAILDNEPHPFPVRGQTITVDEYWRKQLNFFYLDRLQWWRKYVDGDLTRLDAARKEVIAGCNADLVVSPNNGKRKRSEMGSDLASGDGVGNEPPPTVNGPSIMASSVAILTTAPPMSVINPPAIREREPRQLAAPSAASTSDNLDRDRGLLKALRKKAKPGNKLKAMTPLRAVHTGVPREAHAAGTKAWVAETAATIPGRADTLQDETERPDRKRRKLDPEDGRHERADEDESKVRKGELPAPGRGGE